MSADIVTLGAASISAGGIITWQAAVEIGNDNDDVEPFGQPDVIQSLGVASLPYPKDNEGRAEGLILRDCGGKDGVCIGARDTRNARLVGKMGPGDTTLHSTGPGSVAQCFLKHKKKQAGLATDDVDGKSMMFLLDGKNKKSQWTARGAGIQFLSDGAISITEKGGAGFILRGGKIFVMGTLVLPGLKGYLMQCVSPSSPAGPAALAMTAVLGVSG
jgi:hypothetical protein